MDEIGSIIGQLEEQRDAIERALEALRGVAGTGGFARGRKATKKRAAKRAGTKRGLTDEGRRRLSELMKARWASKHPPIRRRGKKAASKKRSAAAA